MRDRLGHSNINPYVIIFYFGWWRKTGLMLFHAASYDLPEHAQVTLSIYDILGEQIKTLVNQSQDAGNKIAVWNGTVTFPSGDWKMTSQHTKIH